MASSNTRQDRNPLMPAQPCCSGLGTSTFPHHSSSLWDFVGSLSLPSSLFICVACRAAQHLLTNHCSNAGRPPQFRVRGPRQWPGVREFIRWADGMPVGISEWERL